MGIPGSGERAKARRGGNLYPCATRERRFTYPDADTNSRAGASVPNARLVQRKAAAAALHPNTRSNGPTGERLTEPFGADRDANRDANRDAPDAVTVGAVTVGVGNAPLKL